MNLNASDVFCKAVCMCSQMYMDSISVNMGNK